MKRAPTTFSLVLALVALALLLALTLAGLLSTRGGLKAAGETYGRLVVSTALAADELATRSDTASMRTLDALKQTGVAFSTAAPPPATVRVASVIREIGRTAGDLLGDPSRVVVTQSLQSSQIWVRSEHDPRRWIVLHAVSYRQQLIDSTLVVTLLAGLIALAIAGVAARLLTRPLERLSAHATALLAGDPMIQQLHGSPREVRQLAQAIGAAGARLRDVARERELMLAGISHDLRTPLARLRLALELGDADDPQRREAMVGDLQELDSALEQCLAFVRDGRDEALREVDIITLVGQLLALREQPDTWQLDGPALLPARVRPTLLRRAIGNLMDNAERHGAAPFKVSLGCDGDALFMRVTDHGSGVAPALLDRLGQPFLRGDQARSSTGSGLGLSIVMRAAELHGGTLELGNGSYGGLVATIRIPVAPTII